MKTLLTTLSALALVLTITGCSKENSAPVAPEDMPIQLDANLLTKAAIAGTTFPANTNGVFYVSSYATAVGDDEPADFSTSHFAKAAVNSDASSKLKFANDQYYHPTKALYFYAYAPVATAVVDGSATETPKVEYTLTGQEDIMSAKDVTGITKADVKQNPATVFPKFAFTHKLKQLKFKVIGGEMFENSTAKLKSVSLINTSTKAVMDMVAGDLTFSIPGALIAYSNTGTGLAIPKKTEQPAVIPGSIMIEPGVEYEVEIILTNGSRLSASNTLTGDRAGEAGVSHNITLTVNPSAITLTATIEAWVDGDDSTLPLE